MATNTYVALRTTTVGTAVSSVTLDLTGITGYTDLVLVFDGTTSGSINNTIRVGNGTIDTGSNYSCTILSGNGSSAVSTRRSNDTSFQPNYNGYTNSTQSNMVVHFMNYSNTTTHKTILSRSNNASTGVDAVVGLWRSTSAINQIQLLANGGYNWQVGSTFTIYGIAAENTSFSGATGGTLYSDATYNYHVFDSSGFFTITGGTKTCDILLVAGGGGGGYDQGGGGGAGGMYSLTSQTLIAGTNTVTIGAGGVGGSASGSIKPTNGGDTTFGNFPVAIGGGRGGRYGETGGNGGSGGGESGGGNGFGSGTSGQGSSGGDSGWYGAGGGGKSAAGANTPTQNGANPGAGAGGAGATSVISGGAVTGRGHLSGGSYYFAGGGGGGSTASNAGGAPGTGGVGGGGNGQAQNYNSPATAGLANTGGGGGGGNQGGQGYNSLGKPGGSGIVVIRYAR